MSGYGLQLRKKPVATRPALPPPAPGFGAGDEDDDDVEKDIARQAAMKRSKKEVRLLDSNLYTFFSRGKYNLNVLFDPPHRASTIFFRNKR